MLRKTMLAAATALSAVAFLAAAGVASAAPTVYTMSVQTGAPGVAGAADPNVQSSLDDSIWGPAYNDPCCGAYSTIAGTGWDSVTSTGFADPGNYYFRASLNLPANAVNPALSGEFYADNIGTAYVNGSQVAAQSGCVAANFQATPTSFESALAPGANTLSFTVYNCPPGSNPVGLDFKATASYTLSPTSKADCKDGGWQNVTDANGTAFKNQGDCVSYVATDGRNLAG